jgi:hypothetical protein
MCKKLLLVVTLLSFVSFVSAAIPIDDFEAYWGQPDLDNTWTQDVAVGTPILMQAGAGQGYQAMDIDWSVPGGWEVPGDLTDFAELDHSSVTRSIPALDFTAGNGLKMMVKVEAGWDIAKTNYFLIEYSGDGYAQTWIAGPAVIMPWWAPHNYPAVICPDGWDPPPGSAGVTPDTVLIHPADGWKEVVITDDMYVGWGQPLVDFDAMTGIHLQLWSGWKDESGNSGTYKVDSTGGTHWPAGPLTGSLDVDNIRYDIPEPATIALLGLGGLALLRKRS